MRALIVFLIVLASSLAHAEASADKLALSHQILSPLVQMLRSGELGKAFLPPYNKHRASKGKRPLSLEEIEPIFQQTSAATEKAYVDAFANEFSLEELQFIDKLFSTKFGADLMSAFSQSVASGSSKQSDPSRFPDEDIAAFKKVAQENPELFYSLTSRLERVSTAARNKLAAFIKTQPELKFPD